MIGFVGSFIANGSVALLNKLKVDDPVGKSKSHIPAGTRRQNDAISTSMRRHDVASTSI